MGGSHRGPIQVQTVALAAALSSMVRLHAHRYSRVAARHGRVEASLKIQCLDNDAVVPGETSPRRKSLDQVPLAALINPLISAYYRGFMKIRRIVAVTSIFLLTALMTGVLAAGNAVPGWDPDAFRDQNTLQIMTTNADGEEHWSNLWLVVIDHKLYVRLGDRSWDRVQKNKTVPWVKLKVGDKQFDKVLLETAPE